jgi:hypothetical protein
MAPTTIKALMTGALIVADEFGKHAGRQLDIPPTKIAEWHR